MHKEQFQALLEEGLTKLGKALEAGADILVAGTFLFGHQKGLAFGVKELLRSGSKTA